jgi:hypothetical protein
MKLLKILAASVLALTLISAASAQTTFRITGSTAFRAAVYQSILNIMAPGFVYGYSGTSLSGSSQAIFTGNTTGGNNVIIKTSFSGSVGGISTLAKNLTIGPSGTFTGGGGWLVNSTAQSTGGTPSVPLVFDTPAVTADIAMADCYQKSTPTKFHTPLLTDNTVGVVDFEWVLTPGTAALGTVNAKTNLTNAEIADSLVNGTLTLSQLSGNAGDTESVQAVGRDSDSGTRIQALACSKSGINAKLKQYQPLFNGATTPTQPPPAPGTQITGAALWPGYTLNTINYPVGDEGYSGGGSLAGAVKISHSGSFPTYANWFLSYLGINDAATITNGIVLKFNGTVFSNANVEDGKYKYWGNEHLFYRTTFTGVGLTVAGLLVTDIKTNTASVSGIKYANMTKHREADGGGILAGGTP